MSDREHNVRSSRGISDELRPYVDRGDAESLNLLGERLREERSPRRLEFRAELRAHLSSIAGRAVAPRPRRLRQLVTAYVASGLALLAVAAIGLAGAGPLGY